MRMRSLILLFCGTVLFAQEAPLSHPGLNRLLPKDFDRMLRKGLEPEARKQLATAVEQQNECSIPLLEYKVPHPERYTIRRMPVPPAGDPMAKSMPVCKR